MHVYTESSVENARFSAPVINRYHIHGQSGNSQDRAARTDKHTRETARAMSVIARMKGQKGRVPDRRFSGLGMKIAFASRAIFCASCHSSS
jgi:hypothetical protein